jgi:hypothetical protein
MRWNKLAAIGLLRELDLPKHRVREYEDRIAVWRKDGARLSWEELQDAKQVVWGDRVAVEVYPATADVVNLRHTRHLWSTPRLREVVQNECTHPEFGGPTGPKEES